MQADPYKEHRTRNYFSANFTYVDFVPVGDFLIYFSERHLGARGASLYVRTKVPT